MICRFDSCSSRLCGPASGGLPWKQPQAACGFSSENSLSRASLWMNTRHLPTGFSGSTEVAGSVAEIVSRVLEGDREAFRSLVEAHAPAVLGLCRRLLCGSRADAEEVTQETFVNAYRYLPRLVDRHRFQPWLYQIARSLCRDRRRRRKIDERAMAVLCEKQRRQRLDVVQVDGVQVDGARGSGESTVCSALSDLPLQERKVLYLRYFDGLSYGDISRRMELSGSQVDHLIRKARARLARRLAVRQQVENR